MLIEYIAPLSRGFSRMKKSLFQPFDISKWMTLGFAAFLADLMEFNGGGSGSSSYSGDGRFDWYDFFHFPRNAWEWLNDNPLWFALILVGLFLLILLLVLLTWLSSRGKFVFLDNVVHDKALIVVPWKEFGIQGNSLFLWRLVYGIISFAFFISIVIVGFVLAYNYYLGFYELPAIILMSIGLFMLGLILMIIASYISLFLNDFVVPLMYKNTVRTNQAWRIFLQLLNKNVGYFFLYGLFILGLYIIVFVTVILFGFATCCCGFVLLVIPYIGSVVLLPVSYTFRALSLEFIEQFGSDYKIFPDTKDEISQEE